MDLHTQIALRLDRLQLLHHSARRREMSEIGLWRGQMPILDFVIAHDGCTQARLAQELGLSPASVAISTKRMMHAGLLTKRADDANLRCNKLSVTAAGREKAQKGRELAERHNAAVFSALTEDEQETLCTLLDRLIAHLDPDAGEVKPLDNYILKNRLVQDEIAEIKEEKEDR